MKAVATLQRNPVIEMLKRTRHLISDPDNWIQGWDRQHRFNRPTRRCVSAAAERAQLEMKCPSQVYVQAMEALAETIKSKSKVKINLTWGRLIPRFNDRVKHHQVLQVVDENIKRLTSTQE